MRGAARLQRKTEHGRRRHQLVRHLPAVGVVSPSQKKEERMKLRIILAGALLVVFSMSALAQDQAAMEAMAKAGTPGEPHKKLDAFVGTWNTKITMWMAPNAPPMTSTGTSENRWAMAGRYLEQRFK